MASIDWLHDRLWDGPIQILLQVSKEGGCQSLAPTYSAMLIIEQYGNVFSFVLVGKKHTVCIGPEGNNFVLNGAVSEISAADIYRGLTLPIFGKDVCYDCSPAKLMEQKKVGVKTKPRTR